MAEAAALADDYLLTHRCSRGGPHSYAFAGGRESGPTFLCVSGYQFCTGPAGDRVSGKQMMIVISATKKVTGRRTVC